MTSGSDSSVKFRAYVSPGSLTVRSHFTLAGVPTRLNALVSLAVQVSPLLVNETGWLV
jgi:hypothetical protein